MCISYLEDLILYRKILVFGILILFIFLSVSPLTVGLGIKYSDEQLIFDDIEIAQLDNTDATKITCYSPAEQSSTDYLLIRNQIEPYITPPNNTLSGPMDSAWPMTCYDQANTGRSPYNTTHITGLEKWRFRCDGSDSGPVIDKEGNIYFGDWDRFIISVYPNGTERWRYKMDDWVWTTTLALSEDNTVYAGSWDHKIYALSSTTGHLIWKKDTGATIESSPVIADDGSIYTANFNSEVWAIYPNGTTRWVYDTHGSDILGDMAIADDGTLYVGTKSGHLNAIYPNGTLQWNYKTGGPIYGTPSIGDDGTIYAYSFDNHLYAFYPNNGTIKWRTNFIICGEETNVAIAADGTLYVGGEDLWAVYPNGTLKWVFEPGEYHQIDKSCIAISAEGTLYFGTQIKSVDGGDIIAVNPDGTLKWRKRIADEWIWSSPCIAEDGTIYICSQWEHGGYLHAFGPQVGNSPPGIPVIEGKKQWKVESEKFWKFTSIDPDNNPVSFYIDWGDGNEGWTVERASGERSLFGHIYEDRGSYTIRAKARDTLGEESDWAYWTVTVPYSYQYPAWQWLCERFPILIQILNLLF
jgi:outer membrane protein assembly factor BamB